MEKYIPFYREKEITLFMLTKALVMLHTGLPELVELLHAELYAQFTMPATLFIGRKSEPLRVSSYTCIDKILENFTERPSFMLVIVQECCPCIQELRNDLGEPKIFLTIGKPGCKTSSNFLVPPKYYTEPLDQLFKRSLEQID